jgi:hypothetical protein
MEPEFSNTYEVFIRRFTDDFEGDITSVLVLANSLREATDKAEDYAKVFNQDGVYAFYDIVSVEEQDEVFLGFSEPVKSPEPTQYSFHYVNAAGEISDPVFGRG